MMRKPARRMGLKLGWAVTRRAIWVIGFCAFVLVYGATLFIPSVTGAVLGLLSKMGVSSAVSLTSDVVQLQKRTPSWNGKAREPKAKVNVWRKSRWIWTDRLSRLSWTTLN